MPHRHAISDADWDRIKELLPGRPGQTGWLAEDNRLFIDAVLCSGQDRRPLAQPARTLRQLELRLEAFRPLGPEGHLAAAVRGPARPRPGVADPRLDRHPRPPLRRRGRKKSDGTGGQDEQALGRSRGGFGTKVHVAVNGLGLPVKLVLTPGQAADVTQAETLIRDVPFEVVIADRGYDSQAVVEAVETGGGEAVIPSRKNRKVQRAYDRERYKDRNLVERFWAKMKRYRRVATRTRRPPATSSR